VVGLLLGSFWSLALADWPGWRGETRDGRAANVVAPASWPEKLNRVWVVPVGVGHASPVVVGDNLFLLTREGDDEVVQALALSSGRTLWRKSYPVAFKAPMGSGRHGKGPKSTPVWGAGRLYTFGITGVFSAWSAESGELIWRRTYEDRFPKTRPHFGVAMSPLFDAGRVVAHFGGGKGGALIAFDGSTGEEIWSEESAGPSYASPVVVELEGRRQIVTQTHEAVVGVDASSGELLWEWPFAESMTRQNTVTPLVVDGLVVTSGKSRGIVALRPVRSAAGWSVETAWKVEDLSLDMSSPVDRKGLVFGLSHRDKGRLFALSAADGTARWQGPPRAGPYASLVSLPGAILVLTADAELLLLDADSDEFRVLKRYPMADTPTWAHVVPVRGGVLIKDLDSLALWTWSDAAAR
jgi:outer membrane protein assembly factor BamB